MKLIYKSVYGSSVIAVDSLEHAAREARHRIEAEGIGSRDVLYAYVSDHGKKVAKIHYNGCVEML